jgi:hypothetical protein
MKSSGTIKYNMLKIPERIIVMNPGVSLPGTLALAAMRPDTDTPI